ncbi:MAG: PD-(D/E)XK nuclease family protein [Chloroflexi bacterium]|nr:PD-(D/E)XK nuclease family protein [Chloroflexota bacterium]
MVTIEAKTEEVTITEVAAGELAVEDNTLEVSTSESATESSHEECPADASPNGESANGVSHEDASYEGLVPYGNGFSQNGLSQNGHSEMDMSMDRPNIKAVFSMELRMSGIRECMRRLAYEAFGFPESDTEPLRNRIMMAQGHLLEGFVKEAMRDEGWIINEEDGVILRHGPVVLTGHPDGVALHPNKADGMPAVLEIKTRSKGMAEYAWTYGVDVSNPEAVEQAALYSKALFGEIADVVIATMERTSDQFEWRAQRVPAYRVERAYAAALERINEVTAMIIKGQVPEPEYPQGDANCKSCPFRSMCGNAAEPELVVEGGLSDEELFEQVRIWANASSRIPKTPSNPATKEKKTASEAIKAHYIETKRAGDEIEVDGQRYKLTLSTKPGTSIDFDAFNELVDPEIREQVVMPTESHTMRITPVKDKSQKGRSKKAKDAAAHPGPAECK